MDGSNDTHTTNEHTFASCNARGVLQQAVQFGSQGTYQVTLTLKDRYGSTSRRLTVAVPVQP